MKLLLLLSLLAVVFQLASAVPTPQSHLVGSYLPPEQENHFTVLDAVVAFCPGTTTSVVTQTLTTSAYKTTYATSTVTSRRTAIVARTSTLTRTQESIQERSVTRAVTETLTDFLTYTKEVIVQSAPPPVTETRTTVVIFTLPSTQVIQATSTSTVFEKSTGYRFRNAIAFSTEPVVKTITEVVEVKPQTVEITQTYQTVNTFTKFAPPETITQTATSVSVFTERSINVVTPPLILVTSTEILSTASYLTSTVSATTTYTAYSVSDLASTVHQRVEATTTTTVRTTYAVTKTIVHTEDYITEKTIPVSAVSTLRTTELIPSVSTVQFSTNVDQVEWNVVTITRAEVIQETSRLRNFEYFTEFSRPDDIVSTSTRIVNECSTVSSGYSYPEPKSGFVF
ncbi:mucin-6 isoform X2 [Hyalella azteca]|uniref:Mucin-6 isoform X2 n=1 Tax=Hyalella azteca TaxID=294128 RepID=A0A979FNM9_HYAAZ|nr:mucin-6 isoform X2 [Hyalella azteca]